MDRGNDKVMDFFAAASPGLEPLTAMELEYLSRQAGSRIDLGQATEKRHLAGEGGVPFRGTLLDLYRANLHLRTASRVLVRLDEFYVTTFSQLRKKAGRIPWEQYIDPGRPVALRATCHKSRLYHSGAVAERVAGGLEDRLGRAPEAVKDAGDDPEGPPPQLIVVRIAHDLCTISVDSSGDLLHRRGYRLATAKAPLRETLAAGLVLASGWNGTAPLLDPFCGSGSIPIEAALIAARIPPGLKRRFAFMDWPGFHQEDWLALLEEARPPEGKPLPPILGSDRDAGAIQASQANAARAGVGEAIEFSVRAVSTIDPPPGTGWVVTNPPYGLRVSANKDLRNLYAQFGNVARKQLKGWRIAMLCSDERLIGQTRLPFEREMLLVNGGVRVKLSVGTV